MTMTALRLLHSWKFSQGWLQLTDDHQVIIKSTRNGTVMDCHDYFFLSICKGLGAVSNHSLLLLTQSCFSVVPGCDRLLIWEPTDLPWRENPRTECSCSASVLLPMMGSQTSKHSWAAVGGGSLTPFSLASHLLPQKHFSWLVADSASTQVLGGFY